MIRSRAIADLGSTPDLDAFFRSVRRGVERAELRRRGVTPLTRPDRERERLEDLLLELADQARAA